MYYATAYKKPGSIYPSQVIVDSSESMSQDTQYAMANNGYKTVRFITDVEAYVAYSEGKELTTDVVAGTNGKNYKRIVVAA